MPRTTEANQRIREAQRAKILESARRVFARKGMSATITDIAAEAQISLGLAYRYFADKDAIIVALVKQIIPEGDVQQHVSEIPGTPGERLAFLISQVVTARGRREHIEVFQLLNHALHAGVVPDDVRELMGRRYQMLLDAMKQLIVESQASGEVASGDPDQLVTILMACLDGLTRWAVQDPEQYNKYVPDAEIILRLLKP